MEIKFENRFIRTKKLTQEIYASIYLKRPLIIILLIFIWLSFIANLALMIIGQSYTNFAFFGAPAYTAFLLFVYFRQVSLTEKREMELYGKALEIVTIVTDECMECENSAGNSSRLEYENIAGVRETKNLILIISKARLMYTLDKNSFVGGTSEEFIEFLKSKGVKV